MPLTCPVTPTRVVISCVVKADFRTCSAPRCASEPSSDSSTSLAACRNGVMISTFTCPYFSQRPVLDALQVVQKILDLLGRGAKCVRWSRIPGGLGTRATAADRTHGEGRRVGET